LSDDTNPILTEIETPGRTYNSASAADVAKMRNDKTLRERGVRDFYQSVFSTEVGRLAMWDILAAAHAFETVFTAGLGFPNEQATWFEAGKQSLGHGLFLSWMKYDPDGVMLMLQENDARLKSDEPIKPKRKRRVKSPLTQL
jgi:hypothetical protein